MGKIKEYHDEINDEAGYAEIQDPYFELLTEAQWQEEVEAERERLQERFGYGTHGKLMLGMFLNKNS